MVGQDGSKIEHARQAELTCHYLPRIRLFYGNLGGQITLVLRCFGTVSYGFTLEFPFLGQM